MKHMQVEIKRVIEVPVVIKGTVVAHKTEGFDCGQAEDFSVLLTVGPVTVDLWTVLTDAQISEIRTALEDAARDLQDVVVI